MKSINHNCITAHRRKLLVACLVALQVGTTRLYPQMEVFDSVEHALQTVKYTWEQAQWAEKLALLKSTLDQARQYVQLANEMKMVVGDPSQVVGLIDSKFLDGALSDLGIGSFIQDLQQIGGEITALTNEASTLFEPIDVSAWSDPVVASQILSKLQNPAYRLERYKMMEHSITRFDELQQKINTRINQQRVALATLTKKLESAKDDAEVQKAQAQIQIAQEVLRSLESELEKARQSMRDQATLIANRDQMEQLAISAAYPTQLDYYQASSAAASRALLTGQRISVPLLNLPSTNAGPGIPTRGGGPMVVGGSSFSSAISNRIGESTAGVPGTGGGNMACAWVVNDVYRQMYGSTIAPEGSNLSVDSTIESMLNQSDKFTLVTRQQAEVSGQDYVIASSYSQGSTGRHIGIGNGTTVWSNSSSKQAISQNYSTESWSNRYGTTLYFITKQ